MSDLTPEQVQQINQTRAALRHGFEQVYMNFTSYLQKLNIHPQLKMFCNMNFDQGAFWAREGIATMPLNFQPAAPVSEPQTEKTEEKVEEQVSETVSEEKPEELKAS